MSLDIEALKAAARAATPGKWHAPGLAEMHDESHRVIACFSDVDPVDEEERPSPGLDEGDRNARFCAAASPDAVLALIDQLERTERNRDMWNGQCERQADALASERAANAALTEENDRLQKALDAARAELREIYNDQAEAVRWKP